MKMFSIRHYIVAKNLQKLVTSIFMSQFKMI